MNYTEKTNEVDFAAFLVSLGFEMKNYTVTTTINLNKNEKKRTKSGSWDFSDESEDFDKLGNAKAVKSLYKLPTKNEPASNLAELAKLTAHNYQALKTVLTQGKPLQQIIGDGYILLKNENGNRISGSTTGTSTDNLSAIAIACSLGCEVVNYSLDENRKLRVVLSPNKDGLTVEQVEHELKNETNDNNFSPLSVLVSTMQNRKELLTGLYNEEKILILRGEKSAIFDKNTPKEIKERILASLNE